MPVALYKDPNINADTRPLVQVLKYNVRLAALISLPGKSHFCLCGD
jgi:hypothetical protein